MSVPRHTSDAPAAHLLTAREREVLTLIARGLATDGIARELFVTPNTVRTHVTRILDKLRAHNRPHAVAIAFSAGFISIDEYAIPRHPRAHVTESTVAVEALPRYDGA